MIFISKKPAAAAPSGSIGPLVTFDGTNDYMSGFGDMGLPQYGVTTTLTVVGRIVLNGDMDVFDSICTFFAGGLRHLTNGDLQISVNDAGYVGIIPETVIDTNYFDGDTIAFMLAVDTSGGMSGGRSGVLYLNGVQVYSGSVTGGNLVLNDDPGGEWTFGFMGNSDGTNLVSADCNGFWVSVSEAVDPVAEWSNFFDGSNQFVPIATNGVVNGHTPYFWQNGQVSDWNSGLDNNGVAYTMNGAVTGEEVILNMPFDEAPGSAAAIDRAGNYTMTYSGGASLGGPGEGLVMNNTGNANWASITGAGLTPTGNYVLELDFYMDVGTDDMIILSTIPSGEGSGIRLATRFGDAADLAVVYNDTSNGANYVETSGANLGADTWYTLRIERSGTTTTVSVDGVVRGTGTPAAPVSNSGPMYLGHNPQNGDGLRGQIRNLTLTVGP